MAASKEELLEVFNKNLDDSWLLESDLKEIEQIKKESGEATATVIKERRKMQNYINICY